MKIIKSQLRQIIKEEVDKELKQEALIEEGFLDKVKDFFRGGRSINASHVNKVAQRMEQNALDQYNMLREMILENPNLSEEQKRELLNQLGPAPTVRGK